MTIEEIEKQHSGAAYIVTRDVTPEECPWLDEPFTEGELVFPSKGYTYGAIGPSGVAVSRRQGEHPFIEIPLDAVRLVGVD